MSATSPHPAAMQAIVGGLVRGRTTAEAGKAAGLAPGDLERLPAGREPSLAHEICLKPGLRLFAGARPPQPVPRRRLSLTEEAAFPTDRFPEFRHADDRRRREMMVELAEIHGTPPEEFRGRELREPYAGPETRRRGRRNA